MVIFLDILPFGKAPLILSVYGRQGEKADLEKICSETIARFCSQKKRISSGKVDGKQNLVLKVRTKRRQQLTTELSMLPGVGSVTILEQNGEVSF